MKFKVFIHNTWNTWLRLHMEYHNINNNNNNNNNNNKITIMLIVKQ